MLLIHPDFLWNTPLAKPISHYDFWSYSVHEALFLSENEEAVLVAILKTIQQECRSNVDSFSKRIIISHLETRLNYWAHGFIKCPIQKVGTWVILRLRRKRLK